MSHQPFDRNPSGIVFFGTAATDKLYESVSTFTYDAAQNSLRLPNGGYIGTQGDFDSISIASDGNVTLSQSLSIAGNLTVNGTTTTVNSTTVTVQDPIMVLGSGSPTTDDNKDRGIAFNWHTGAASRSGFFGFDDSTGRFTFIPNATITAEVVTGTVGDIEANLVGNASTATTLATARNFSMTGEMTASAVSFNGGADVTLTGVLHQTAVSGQPEITSVDGTYDYLLIWDATTGDLAKVNRSNFITGLGSMSSFTISDLSGNTQTIIDSDTLKFAPGAAITFTVSATDTVSGTLSSNVAGNGLTMASQILAVGAGNGISVAADSVAVTAGSGISVDLNGVHVNAGTGLLNTAAGLQIGVGNGITGAADAISVTAGSGITVDIGGVHVNAGTGLLNTAAGLQIGIGNGITGAADAISVTDGSGILVNSNGVHANLISYASQAVAANAASSTASRTYPIQVNGSDQLVVNVPWTDADTTYTASSGLTLTGTAFSVTDGSGILVNTGGVHANLVDYTVQTVAAASRTTTASRTYAIQVNSSDQLVVNVPWTDADTTYTAGSGLTLVGTTFHIPPSTAGSGLVLQTDGLHLDLNEYSDTSVGYDDAFLTLDSNNVNEQLTTVQDLGTYYAGSGISVDGVGKHHWRPATASVVASAQLSANDVNLCTAGAGGISVWLPSGTAGRFMWIKKVDSAAGTVTINRQGSYTIDGATSVILYHQYESVELVCDGSNWHIV